MIRPNPGPFEPLKYFVQTAIFYRIVGLGGLALFTILFLSHAAAHGMLPLVVGLLLFGAVWLVSSVTACRRCRFYGTWHCLGQGMLVSRLFAQRKPGLPSGLKELNLTLLAIYLLYGLYWLWHSPLLGLLFTIWTPFAIWSAAVPNGFSWDKPVALQGKLHSGANQ